MELAFAPEERDVYSYERISTALAPLGAKPAAERNGKEKIIARSYGAFKSKKRPSGYKHLAPLGRNHIQTHRSSLLLLIRQHARVHCFTSARDHLKVHVALHDFDEHERHVAIEKLVGQRRALIDVTLS